MATKLAPKPNPLLEKLKKALALQQAGEVEKAQKIYKLVVKKAPNSPDANHLLGVSYRQLGDPKQAFEYIQKAIRLAPDRAPYYANLARTMSDIAFTEPESILAVAEKALSLDPNLLEALNLKAISLSRMDRKLEAEEIFQFLIVKYPNYPDAFRNYGILLRDEKVYDKAIAFFNKTTLLDPGNPENYVERARARLACEDFKNSESELADALERFPDNGNIKHEVARLLFKMGETGEGLKYAIAAHEDSPRDYHRLVTLGVHYLMLDQPEKAYEKFKKARELAPESFVGLDWNLSLASLALGDLETGWRLHRSRFDDKASQVIRRTFDVPAWEGEDISDKTVLVWADQGLGDALKAGTMLPDLIERAGKVIIELSKKATPWYKKSFPEALCRPAAFDAEKKAIYSDYDVHANITDLARFFRNSLDDFKTAKRPAYAFDQEQAQGYLKRLKEHGRDKPIIGVGWRSMNLAVSRARLYLSAPQFAPIMDFKDVTFVNLQYAAVKREIDFLKAKTKGAFVSLDDVDLLDDLLAAAALTACCDLVVTANTSVAEIAGVLDVPSFRFGQNEPPLLLGQENPPWHPSQRYFLLTSKKPATAVVPDLKAAISEWLETYSPERRDKRLGLA
ncbi:tetratricopeptide repeat protein [Roseibium aggregatum]|uniref:Tetratricopeptide repeat protein n=1 Tax=Roseibium aggregatum TaxID=187304 RepID=A0A926S5X9_9HYPH|nr:tetratricopeptide repeat protein [Roseibium aggregatum]MBD1546640.1 tetratricopeptide repeat protein [Roseibium aggregatum]